MKNKVKITYELEDLKTYYSIELYSTMLDRIKGLQKINPNKGIILETFTLGDALEFQKMCPTIRIEKVEPELHQFPDYEGQPWTDTEFCFYHIVDLDRI